MAVRRRSRFRSSLRSRRSFANPRRTASHARCSSFSFFKSSNSSSTNPHCTALPTRIISLASGLNMRYTPGRNRKHRMPMTTMDSVYMIRFSSSATVDTGPGMPSRIMKKALSG